MVDYEIIPFNMETFRERYPENLTRKHWLRLYMGAPDWMRDPNFTPTDDLHDFDVTTGCKLPRYDYIIRIGRRNISTYSLDELLALDFHDDAPQGWRHIGSEVCRSCPVDIQDLARREVYRYNHRPASLEVLVYEDLSKINAHGLSEAETILRKYDRYKSQFPDDTGLTIIGRLEREMEANDITLMKEASIVALERMIGRHPDQNMPRNGWPREEDWTDDDERDEQEWAPDADATQHITNGHHNPDEAEDNDLDR